MKHKVKKSKFIQSKSCGDLFEYEDGNRQPYSIVFNPNMDTTTGHYHTGQDELYCVTSGSMTLQLWNNSQGEVETITLNAGESLLIPKNTHHKIIKVEVSTSLFAICCPPWKEEDQHYSEVLK